MLTSDDYLSYVKSLLHIIAGKMCGWQATSPFTNIFLDNIVGVIHQFSLKKQISAVYLS